MNDVDPGLAALGWDERLAALGWDERLAATPEDELPRPGLEPARVLATHRETSIVRGRSGELAARLSGRFRLGAGPGEMPAVGDWVLVDARPAERAATLHAVLPRRGTIARTASDSTRRGQGRLIDAQVLAANVDMAFIVAAIDRPPNLARLERYVALAWGSEVEPVVVLNKSDAATDVPSIVAVVAAIAPGVDVLPVSATRGDGVAAIAGRLGRRRTGVFLGPSGVGKSTLVNALLGESRQATGEIRASDGRGRHTTTHRQLIELPGGGLLIDTPGIRSLELADEAGVAFAFEDVEAVAAACRFADCRHGTEPGCAIRSALADGALEQRRWASYQKLRREEAHVARESDPRAREAERRRWRAIHIEANRRMRAKYGEAM
ncbi:MAG TPA: ribosome small subunit-dependent GTPase A [Candidatus Dormibacteraeota bacterium]|nr:ribosome small subunit-dependent GTPase A [Candidatus Dormibacteraeota bacterium]